MTPRKLGARCLAELGRELGIDPRFLQIHGSCKAKIDLDILPEIRSRPMGKYILVSAITPTPLGEGKTTTTIGLGMALSAIGKSNIITLRQSSLGPTFGIKGGGAGGGRAQLLPLEESLLHLSGDIHAVGQAHNQIAAMVDNSWYHGNPLRIDSERIQIRRVIDVNDRFLRNITIGQGGDAHGIPRQTGFDMTVASELMAILALVDGHSSKEVLLDLRRRIGRMVVAFSLDGKPITADDVRGAGAAAVLMRDTIKPTFMQTQEHTPVFIHAGPFANIAHGCSSIIADRMGLHLAEYVVTEAGFAADMGGEKFFDIKCRTSGLQPAAAVLVTTVRALKAHSGHYTIKPGKPLPPELLAENPEHVREGAANMRKQIENLRQFGVPVVVAINHFPQDHDSETSVIFEEARRAGAVDVAVSRAYAEGGKGAVDLALKVVAAAEQKSEPRFLYSLDAPVKEKIEVLATKIYGAEGVDYSPIAERQLASFEALGYGKMPICMAKTHLSLSHDPKLKGVPRGFRFPIREIRASVGAGFLYALAGDMMTMPGLASEPNAADIDIDENGNIVGLF